MRQIWQISSFATTAILAFAFQLPAQSAKSATGGTSTDKTSIAIVANSAAGSSAAAAPASKTVSAKSASGTVAVTHAAATTATKPASSSVKAKSLAMPLFFEANKGQADPSVRFLTRSKGYTLFVTPTETVLAGAPPTPVTGAKSGDDAKSGFGGIPGGTSGPGAGTKQGRAPVVRMQLAGANASPTVSGVDELHGKVNYLIGRDSSKWATDVPLYSKVSVAGVYPGVDLLFHGNERQLEYDFVVAPGADPSQIAFRIRGAKHIEIDANGNLDMRAGDSEFQMAKPVVYQEVASVRRPIEGSFVRKGRNEIAFRVGEYDRSEALVIDPGIGYATFFGGAGDDAPVNLEVDSTVPGSPKVYVGGTTTTSLSTFTEGHSQLGNTGGAAYGYIAKIDPTITSDPGGTASLDYLTFVGGSELLPGNSSSACVTEMEHVSLDESQGAGEVQPVFSGVTNCGDYPGTPTQAVEGIVTAVLTRLTTIGSGIDASIILGGSGDNFNAFATVDSAGDILLSGSTSSVGLPTSSNAYMLQINGGGSGVADCYVQLLRRADFSQIYSSYLNVGNGTTVMGGGQGGGNLGCGGYVDGTGMLDFGGATFSKVAFNVGAGGANAANGFEPNFPANGVKVSFALQIDPTATGPAALRYATYFGGGNTTNLQTGAVALGNSLVVLVGWTGSNSSAGDIPLANPFQSTNLGAGNGAGQTGFLTVFDTSKTGLASLVLSSYFGGSSGSDQINSVAYDANDSSAFRVLFGGQTASSDFPTANSLQTLQGAQDGFVAEMKIPLEGVSTPPTLYFSTLIGGGATSQSVAGDKISGVGVDSQDVVYVTGETVSSNFYANTNPTTTVNGFQLNCASCNPAAGVFRDTVVFSLGTETGATLNSIVVSPASATVQVGKTVQYTAQGYYSDGSIQELTDSVSWSTGNAGIASVSEGLVTGNAVGGPVTVTAVDGTVSGSASVSVIAATSYALTVTTSGTGFGVETSTPAGISCPPTCSAEFPVGEQVVLSASANGGSSFTGWSASTCSGTGTCVVTMNSLVTVNAAYTTVPSYELLVTFNGTGAATVTSSPSGITCATTCSGNFNPGTQVTLTVTPASGSTFKGWGGACGNTTNQCTLTMNSAEDVFVNLTAVSYPATVTLTGAGGGTVTSQPSGISCPSTCTSNFTPGSTITVNETPAAGSTFAGWSGPCSGTTGSCGMQMNSAQSVTATFVPTTNLLVTIVLAGPAYGTVGGLGTTNCTNVTGTLTGTCSATFPSGTQITLAETPGTGSAFGGWSGGGCTSGNTCAFTLTANTVITSTFNNGTGQFVFSLQPASGMTGTGTVTAPAVGINCNLTPAGVSGACSGTFLSGAIVSIYATPGANSTFANWTGGSCFATQQPCTTVMTAAQTVTVTFTSVTYAVTISEAGSGTGTVTSSPTGISCPPTCTFSFPQGTPVTLTENPGTGSTFASWNGQGCVGNNQACTFAANQNLTIQATFNPVTTFPLTVTDAGTGAGTVTSSSSVQPQIDCTTGSTTGCTANYNSGAVITLNASASTGSTFAGWSGNAACGSGTTCTITMNAAESVTATFNTTTTFLLTVTEAGTGSGTVTSNSQPQIVCPSTCTANIASGTQVTLTETPGTGSTFGGWGGACTGTGSCVVNMGAAQDVTATFNTTQFALTVTDAGSGSGTVTSSPAGINCLPGGGTGCTTDFNSGQQVILTAKPSTGSTFAGWSGNAACSGTGTCTITMSAAESVTATFSTATTFALTVTDAGTGTGTVTSSSSVQPQINCTTGSSAGCTANYSSGTLITLNASPASGSTFAGWSGQSGCGSSGSCTIDMTAAESVTATFNSTAATDLRAVTAPFTDDGSSPVTLTWNPAFPDTNYTAVCSAETTQSDFLLPLITAQTATTITVIPTEGGATPGTVDCIAIPDSDTSDIRHARQQFQASAEAVEVDWATAFPDTNYTVACTAETTETGVSFSSVISDLETGFVSVDIGGIGQGTMECIAVPDSDTSSVRHGRTTFTNSGITPTINVPWNSAFTDTNYAAACSDVELNTLNSSAAIAIEAGSKATGSVTVLNEIDSGTAHCLGLELPAQQFALTVTEAGTGTGTVVSSPGGINCPTTCSANFVSGTQVTLTETAGTGSTFAGWGGAECAGTTCQVVVNSPLAVTATFNLTQFALTVTEAGTGSGTVVSVPQGIDCFATSSGEPMCSADFNGGTQVTLTATPASRSSFFGWSGGGCSGTGTCVVTMNEAVNVTATFNAGANFVLTTTGGTATTVTTNPGGNIVVGLTVSGPVKETITLGCTSSAPQYLTCTITPTTVNLTGNGPTQVAIVLTSYCQGATPGPGPADDGRPRGPMPGIAQLPAAIAVLCVGMLGIGLIWSSGGRRRWALTMAAMLLLAAGGMACGNLPKGPNGVTPAGTYTLTVTATAQGQAPQAVQVNVQVN